MHRPTPTERARVLRGAAGMGMASAVTPVGLGPRVVAFALDYLPMAAYLAVLVALGTTVVSAFPAAIAHAFGHAARAQAIGFVLLTLPVGLYFALSEASALQATWGKRRLGLIVTGPGGDRLGHGRALVRAGAKLVPWELAHAAVWGIAFADGQPAPAHHALLALVWLLVGANAVGIAVWRRSVYDVAVGTRVMHGAGR